MLQYFLFNLFWKSVCVIFFPSHKNAIFSDKKKSLNLFNMGHGDFAIAPKLRFFLMPKTWSYKGISVHFKTLIYSILQYFQIIQ